MKLPPLSFDGTGLVALAAIAGVGLVALWVWKKGGLANAAGAAGTAAVNAAGAAASGAVGAIGASVGLPTPSQTTTDPAVARWIIDHPRGGYFQASLWAGAPALVSATLMSPGSGTPPPPGQLLELFPLPTSGDFARSDRLITPDVTTPTWFNPDNPTFIPPIGA